MNQVACASSWISMGTVFAYQAYFMGDHQRPARLCMAGWSMRVPWRAVMYKDGWKVKCRFCNHGIMQSVLQIADENGRPL